MSHSCFTFIPIGIAHTPYPQKFGIARQSGLVPAAKAIIELDTRFSADSVRGLEEFDYLWVSFVFHDTLAEGFSELVRPPRLGGKIKKGVFATRSPHRPNSLGLSLLKIDQITYGKPIKIYVSGADLLDGTPILDLKPYLPHIEIKPRARAGFTKNYQKIVEVEWPIENSSDFICDEIQKSLIIQSLMQDPRPAHQRNSNKEFFMIVSNCEVRFIGHGNTIRVLNVKPLRES